MAAGLGEPQEYFPQPALSDFRWETPLPGISILQKYFEGCLKSLAAST